MDRKAFTRARASTFFYRINYLLFNIWIGLSVNVCPTDLSFSTLQFDGFGLTAAVAMELNKAKTWHYYCSCCYRHSLADCFMLNKNLVKIFFFLLNLNVLHVQS